MKETISDIHCEYHGETNLVHFVIEFPNGTEKCIRQVMPSYIPDWVTQHEEAKDYEEWYNMALEEAHSQGYVLEGEEELINVEFECPMCGITHYIYNVPMSLVERIKNRRQTGEYIQDILKDYSRTDREKFITGYCDDCQRKLFGTEED